MSKNSVKESLDDDDNGDEDDDDNDNVKQDDAN